MRSYVRAIQASTGLVQFESPATSTWNHFRVTSGSCDSEPNQWLLCQLVDSSAQAPMKDVPSCDKPWGPARRGRTTDLLIGILLQLLRAMGNGPN